MIYTSLFINLLLCLLLLNFQWREQKAVLYLCLILIIFNKRQITGLLLNSESNGQILTHLIFITDPITYLLGPLMLYYFKSLMEKKLVFDVKFLLLSIPSLVIAINLWPYYQFSFQEKFNVVMAIKNHVFVRDFPLRQTLLFSFDTQTKLILLSNAGCAAYSFFLVFKANKANNIKAKNMKLIYSIIGIFTVSILPTLLFVLYANFLVSGEFSLGVVFPANMFTNYQYMFTLVTPVSFLFFPQLIYGLNPKASIIYRIKELYQEVFVNNEEAITEITEVSTEKDKIIAYMNNEKPYLSPTFSMHTLSKDLNIPHLRVSSCFNKEINISFPEYRKRKRVDHAIELFKQGAHKKMSIEGIGAMSGFKNKSSFFLAFQTEFKMTPSEWIEKNVEKVAHQSI